MNREYDLFLPWKTADSITVFDQIKPESLFRLNPHWVINEFACTENVFTADMADHETGSPVNLSGEYNRDRSGFPIISADNSEWGVIRFLEKDGSLHADVSYVTEPPEEIEQKIVLWLRAIKEYLRLYLTKSLNTRFFKLVMNRVILPMTPSQRKISLMLMRITVLEILVIFIILFGWFFFLR